MRRARRHSGQSQPLYDQLAKAKWLGNAARGPSACNSEYLLAYSTLLGSTFAQPAPPIPCKELVFFGRHEERKEIVLFCDALDLIGDCLASADILVTFLGGFGNVKGGYSALYLAKRSSRWKFPRFACCRITIE